MLALSSPEEATIINFADDLAVAVVEKHPEDVKVYEKETVGGLNLAGGNTEAVLSTTEYCESNYEISASDD